jgi:CubicO group peptidase (beta-lactamase class C family)
VIEPGSEPQVTTVGHVVAGLIIEEVTGRQVDELMREYVFDPAGASSAYLAPQEVPPDPVVNAYVSEGFANALEVIWPTDSNLGDYADVREQAVLDGPDGPLFDLMVVPQDLLGSVGWTGGGLEARPLDAARAMRALFDGTVLSDDLAAAMTQPLPDSVYAQGIVIRALEDEPSYQQSGVVPGYNSGSVYLPEWDIAVVASSNTESPGLPTRDLVNQVALIVRTAYIQAATSAAE